MANEYLNYLMSDIDDGIATALELTSNKNTLKKFSESGGKPFYNGQPLGGGSGSDELWLPSVNPSGDISWTRSKSATAPATQNIKGAKGDKGDKGDKGEQGEKGEPGERGQDGQDGAPGQKGDTGNPGAAGTSVTAIQAASQADALTLSQQNPNNIYFWV